MSETATWWRRIALGTAILGASVRASPTLAQSTDEVLRRSDVSTLAPDSFRASLTVTSRGQTLGFTVWRSGESRLLVQFLNPEDKGKFLLRRDAALYFIAPRAKKPIRLNGAYRLSGAASLDEILGTRYSKEYTVVRSSADGNEIALHLAAIDPKAPYPLVSYIVDRASYRPTRSEFQLASGKTARIVEFLGWNGHPSLHPSRLRIIDTLNPKATADVEIVAVELQPVPADLFDLADDSGRRKLTDHDSVSPR